MTVINLLISTGINNKDANPLIRRKVLALKVGNFAIHKSGVVWNLTHINSGYYLREFFDPINAKKYAVFLNSMSIDWRRIHGKKDMINKSTKTQRAIARHYAESLVDILPSSVYFTKHSTEPQ